MPMRAKHSSCGCRQKIAEGLAPEARLRVTQLVFGPYSPFPVAFRVTGPDPQVLRAIANQVQAVMRANPGMRQVNRDWGERVPTAHFVLDQDRLRLIGLTPTEAAQQLQFLLTGVTVTQVREDIRTVDVVARSCWRGTARSRPPRRFHPHLRDGRMIPLDQIGHVEVRMEDPILRRRDRMPTITVRGDIDESLQPPEVSMEMQRALQPMIAKLPAGYRIEMAGRYRRFGQSQRGARCRLPDHGGADADDHHVPGPLVLGDQHGDADRAARPHRRRARASLVPSALRLQRHSWTDRTAGILMRNTLILIGQIHTNQQDGLDPYHAVVEATVQRARPVILTALAAVLAFIPLTRSVFWGSMAYTLIGGTAVGTVLILVFLPALYAIWFRVRPLAAGNLDSAKQPTGHQTTLNASPSVAASAVTG